MQSEHTDLIILTAAARQVRGKREREGADPDQEDLASGVAPRPSERALHVPRYRADHRPGCDHGRAGFELTEFSAVWAYTPTPENPVKKTKKAPVQHTSAVFFKQNRLSVFFEVFYKTPIDCMRHFMRFFYMNNHEFIRFTESIEHQPIGTV